MLAPIAFSKVGVGISVGATYRTSLSRSDVDRLYARVMPANGWVPIRSRGSSLDVSCFAKGDLRAAVEFPGKSGVHWDYAIDVTWGALICE